MLVLVSKAGPMRLPVETHEWGFFEWAGFRSNLYLAFLVRPWVHDVGGVS